MGTEQAQDPEQPGKPSRLWPKALVFVAIIAMWYGLSAILPLEQWLLGLLAWIEGLGVWGPVVFVILYIPACVVTFPDIFPNAAAGAIWGAALGTVIASLGRLVGSAVTFLLARGIAASWIESRTASDARFAAMSDAIAREGFRIVVLLRLCPLFPAVMLNYALGLTRVNLRAYAAGTLIGMLPRTLVVAYVGSGARSLADLADGGVRAGPAHLLLFWGGLAVSLVVVVILARKARRMLNAATVPSQ